MKEWLSVTGLEKPGGENSLDETMISSVQYLLSWNIHMATSNAGSEIGGKIFFFS